MPTIDRYTRCGLPASFAASIRLRVTATSPRPLVVARWMITSTSATAAASPRPLRRSPTTQPCAAGSRSRRVSTRTSSPASSSRGTSARPSRPVPPVTRTCFVITRSMWLEISPCATRNRMTPRNVTTGPACSLRNRSLSGLATIRMPVIRPPAISGTNTPSSVDPNQPSTPGVPFTSRIDTVRPSTYRPVTVARYRATFSAPCTGSRATPGVPPPSATDVTSSASIRSSPARSPPRAASRNRSTSARCLGDVAARRTEARHRPAVCAPDGATAGSSTPKARTSSATSRWL